MTIRSEIRDALLTILPDRVFGDRAPDKTLMPYYSILGDISDVPALSGDGRPLQMERLFQVDLWELQAVEDGTLRDATWATLSGLRIPSSPCRLVVRSAPRIHDPDFLISHRAFTVAAMSRAPV